MGNKERAALAKAEFEAAMNSLGVRLVGEYVNTVTRVAAICPRGHECAPRPDKIRIGKGPCAQCGSEARASGRTRADTPRAIAARDAFIESMGRMGYAVTGSYVDNWTRVAAICPNGHPCNPRPGHIQQGKGGCELCAGRAHDAVYVVSGNGMVKFGITSGNPRDRLATHARDGLNVVHRLVGGLPIGEARRIENQLLNYMRLLGAVSVRGREYFSDSFASLVVSRADDLLTPWL